MLDTALGQNRINDIDSSSDLNQMVTYINEPDAITTQCLHNKKSESKEPATSLKVIADNFRPPETDLKFMFKILKNDETTPIDDLGFILQYRWFTRCSDRTRCKKL